MSDCPIYSEYCDRGVCVCPSCDRDYDDRPVCGNNGENYDTRCEMRAYACQNNLDIFEVPCFDEGDDVFEGSGDDVTCFFGGEYRDQYGVLSDDEDNNVNGYCECEWHCPDRGNAVIAEGKVYESKCAFYRDGLCGLQKYIEQDNTLSCACGGIGTVLKNISELLFIV